MREIYSQSLDRFVIERRNLTALVNEMAHYTNGAIMKKLVAIRTLVNISEQSYRRFAKTDELTRNTTVKFMAVRKTFISNIQRSVRMIFFVETWFSKF